MIGAFGQHLATVVWLRRRLQHNQARRSPIAALLTRVLHVIVLVAAVAMFLVFLVVGRSALGDAEPVTLLLVWDGFVVAFLFFSLTGLLAQLQRSELVSADRFLPFPVAPHTVFAVNYLGSSVLAADVIVLGSGMLGLAIGLSLSRGPGMLLLVPAMIAFLLLVTAASHQFQGWLATLMTNRHRRRQVVAFGSFLLVAVFVSLAQAGRLVDYVVDRSAQVPSAEIAELRRDLQRLGREQRSGAITRTEYEEAAADVRRRLAPLTAAAGVERQRLLRETIVPAHRWLPPGWLPYGAMALAEARVVPAILGTLGLVLLGMASLARAHRTTLRLHLGAPGGAIAVTAPARTRRLPATRTRPPARLLEWRLPYVSEHASAITMAGFRTLTRAPEARLMLLSPLILAVVFGGMMMRGGGAVTFASDPSVFLRPILSVGLFLLILLGMNQIAANQFGFDRDGFRVFVLGAAARRDVLLGKNLALLPLALGLGLLTLLALQLFVPMRMDHFAATLAQTVSVYLVYCLLANLLSIYAPIPIKPGTLRPARTNTILTLVNLAAILAFPFALLPTLVPLGVEAALDWWAGVRGLPIYLGLSVVQVALVVLAYQRALDWQGSLLQAREQQILDAVTVTAE